MRRTVVAAAALAGVAAAGFVTERTVIGRLRRRSDPERDALLTMPADVTHRDLTGHDGAVLHLVERGQGRPLVLLHGITLRAEVWSPQLHQLAASSRPASEPQRDGRLLAGAPDTGHRYRVIACDLRGHGRSTSGSDGFGLDRLAHDLATVLTELDLRDTLVAGHSMGGMALMRFCGDHPDVLDERVAGLAFVATASTFPVPAVLLARAEKLGDRLVRSVQQGRTPRLYRFSDNNLSWMLTRLVFGKNPPPGAVEQIREMVATVPPETLYPSGVGLFVHDAREALRATRTPSVMVAGKLDVLTPMWEARRIADLLPDCRLHVLDGAGHQLMQERPEELARFIDELADRVGVRPLAAGR